MTVSEEMKRLLVTVPKKLYVEFDRVTKANGLKKSAVVRQLISDWLEKQKSQA